MEMITTQEADLIEEPIEISEKKSINYLVGDNWYKDHPENILGMAYEASGKWGKVTKYSGGIDVLSRIQVDESFIGANKSLIDPLASVSYDMNVSGELIKPEIADIIENVIKKGYEEIKQSKKRKTKVIEEDAVVTPVEELNTFAVTYNNLNPEISLEEVEVYVWYKSSIGKPLSKNYVSLFKQDYFTDDENLRETYDYSNYVNSEKVDSWVRRGLLCYYKGNLIPTFEYVSGNMYDKKMELERDAELITTKYGKDVLDNQRNAMQNAFRQVYDKRLVLGGDNSLVILAYSKIASEFKIERIEDIPEGEKFKIKRVSAGSDKNYGKPDLIKDLNAYGYDRSVFDEINLQDAFGWWLLNKKPLLLEPISHLDVYKYYVQQSPIRSTSKDDSAAAKKKAEAEKEKLKSSTQKEGERLFAIFLSTQLTSSDKIRLESQWNIDYNNYLPINLDKVPVAYTMAKYIFGKEEVVQPVKRDAIAFTMNNGTGILAYDVGVGKTPSAIWTISSFFDAGYCKRPLIVVPNQVYRQFISEIKIFTPHIPIIEGFNLGKDYIENFKDAEGNITKTPEGSITIMTYEGFESIGFSQETTDLLLSKLYEILNQGGASEQQSNKKVASFEERIATIVGRGLKGGMYNIEDFGFDFMCYDEAHKMKKVFTSVKGEAEEDKSGKVTRGKNPYVISSGSPSSIALKGFMINQYILSKNNYKNILLLTATPFTNSPLEIFSMLSMVAYEQLRDTNLANIKSFFDNYVKTSTELVINSKLKPEFKQVILGFNNLISLQSLIRRFILYKTGEEAGVQRPKKYVLPYVKEIEDGIVVEVPEIRRVETYIQMTPQQKAMMEDIISYVESGTALGVTKEIADEENVFDEDETMDLTAGEEVDEDDLNESEKRGVRTIKGLSYSRNLALSPYLYEFSGLGKPDYKTYVESSPKLLYVMQSIKSVKDYHQAKGQDVSGQVIYMDRGIRYFPLLKEYLVNEVGYKPHEIGIIQSGLPKTGVRSKEYVKNLFNGEIYNEKTQQFDKVDVAQRIKIVIGSSTIKEGMNLQKYGTVLYNCFIDWNPTDIQQLEGRIWRQKNTFDAVRIANPLLVDSADIFLFQKLQEKTARLNTIWSTDGKTNVLKNEEFNTEELKYALIRDPRVIAQLRIIEDKGRLTSEMLGFERQIEIVNNVKNAAYQIVDKYDKVIDIIKDYRDFKPSGDKLADSLRLSALVIDLDKKQTDKEGKKIYSTWERKRLDEKELENASILTDTFYKPYWFSDFSVAARDMKRYKTDFIDQYNIKFSFDTYTESLNDYLKGLQFEITAIKERLANIESPENFKLLVEAAEEEKEKQKISYKALPALIADFGKLNYLLTNKKVIENKKVEYAQCPPLKDEGKYPIDSKSIDDLKTCLAKEVQTKDLYYIEGVGYTKERQAIHNKIVKELFTDVKCIDSKEQPIAIFTGGSPASGKSSFLQKNAQYLLSKNIFKLDADEIRRKLPEFEGWNANSTHSETQDIVSEILERLGSENCRYDFIYDGTMNKAKKYFSLIKKVKELGYKVYIIFMEIPYSEAKKRALNRYSVTGRYVPEEVIDDFFTMEGNKTKGQAALDTLKPLVDGFVVADGITGQIIDFGGEGIPESRNESVYSNRLIGDEGESNDNQDLLDTIAGLEFLAEDGNQDAIDTIAGLELLLN